jgi:hypothetical protein
MFATAGALTTDVVKVPALTVNPQMHRFKNLFRNSTAELLVFPGYPLVASGVFH